MTADFGVNQGLVEEQFLKWVDNPLAVDEAWRTYFESLAPTDRPQISSAGTVIAPVTATGVLSPAPLPSDGKGSGTLPTAEFDRDGGVRDSVFFPSTTETTLAPLVPEERTSFPPSSEVLA
ncbi:MAG: hypothetical protein JRG67_03995, partial [Deltaproteobacteria bacterium]|nr:hypothetical protein [Deltaproteobacteria bacterium]MBW2213425.1 hypothetical protein [Deltaproteobacteria bacterium]MBW2379206.1 hypothetical protein [Deltaproteobacteria bacterium]